MKDIQSKMLRGCPVKEDYREHGRTSELSLKQWLEPPGRGDKGESQKRKLMLTGQDKFAVNKQTF